MMLRYDCALCHCHYPGCYSILQSGAETCPALRKRKDERRLGWNYWRYQGVRPRVRRSNESGSHLMRMRGGPVRLMAVSLGVTTAPRARLPETQAF
jgi:hypothetical protein